MGGETEWTRARSAAGDEHVLPAVVVHRLFLEVSVKSLELKPGDIQQPEPFVLGRPPDRMVPSERDVDEGRRRPHSGMVWVRLVLVPPVQPNGYLVVEREGVPGEPTAGMQ